MRPHARSSSPSVCVPVVLGAVALSLSVAVGAAGSRTDLDAALAAPGPRTVSSVGSTISASTPTALPESYGLVDTWVTDLPTGRMLFHPTGVAVDTHGRVVVADTGNGRLVRASARGRAPDSLNPNDPAQHIGQPGSGLGAFADPEDVAVSAEGDRIYVADTGNRRVQVLATDGTVLAAWTDVGLPRGIAFGSVRAPSGSAGGDRVYVSDAESGRVRVFADDGTPLARWPVPAPGDVRAEPLGLSVTPSGDLVVADHANQRIVWLDADGSEGPAGDVRGALALDNTVAPGGAPLDVGVDDHGDVFVAVTRGVLHFRIEPGRGTSLQAPGTGVAGDLAYVDTWPMLRCGQPGCGRSGPCSVFVAERDSHEGVQRLDVRPGVGLFVTYAPALRWLDRVVAYPARRDGGISRPVQNEGWVWPLQCRDYVEPESDHATDVRRIDAGREPYYAVGVDSSSTLRIWRGNGSPYVGARLATVAAEEDLAVDTAAPAFRVALLDFNAVSFLDATLEPGPPLRVLDADQIIRRERTQECRRALPMPGRGGSDGPCIPDDRWWLPAVAFDYEAGVVTVLDAGSPRAIVRAGGRLVARPSLGAPAAPFRSFTDVDYDLAGRLWVLARDGAVHVYDEHGRDRGELTLVGAAGGSAESLSVAPDGSLFVLTGDTRIVKYVPEVAPTPTPTPTVSPMPGPSPRPTRTLSRPTATALPTFLSRALPVAQWKVPDLAGPGRYRDLAVGIDGRVIVPDGDRDRVLVFGPAPPTPTPPASPTPDDQACRFRPDKAAVPSRLPLGDTTEVTLRLAGTCGSRHSAVDVAVVVDTSCQMAGERFARAREGLVALVDALTVPGDRLAVITFDEQQGGARVVVGLTADRARLRDAGSRLTTDCHIVEECLDLDFHGLGYIKSYLYPNGCRTEGRISDGLRTGREALLGPAARPGAGKALILLSSSLFDSRHVLASLSRDPAMFDPPLTPAEQAMWASDLPADAIAEVTDREHARWEGWLLREAGVRVFTTGVGVDAYGSGHPPDAGLLAALAWPADGYRPAGAPGDLAAVLGATGREISARVLMATVVITDRIPVDMRFVPGSDTPAADVLPDGGRSDALLRWSFQNVALTGLPPLSYRLEPLECGVSPTNDEAYADFIDGLGAPGRSTFPVPTVDVDCPIPTDEPTPTAPPASPSPPEPTASATPTHTRTPTDTATATPSRTPTATPSPDPTASRTPRGEARRIYVPFAYVWRCKPSPRPVDVVLLIDTSSSMTGEKLDAARNAASVLLFFVDLRIRRDRAAVVSFDVAARVNQGLTADRATLAVGLAGLATTPGTRIDLGIAAAVGELLGARRRDGVDRAIVLLTDGLPMAGTEAETLAEADRARAAGVSTWTIGLGSDVDPDFLGRVAGAGDRVLIAPAPGDLEGVYRRVASGIVCR
jgi:Mg-chelatase subunit ChlD/DNA-binding beta-propeller fold protein YncE